MVEVVKAVKGLIPTLLKAVDVVPTPPVEILKAVDAVVVEILISTPPVEKVEAVDAVEEVKALPHHSLTPPVEGLLHEAAVTALLATFADHSSRPRPPVLELIQRETPFLQRTIVMDVLACPDLLLHQMLIYQRQSLLKWLHAPII